MTRSTLANVQSRKQMNDAAALVQAEYSAADVELTRTFNMVVIKVLGEDGKRTVFSAATRNGAEWSVQLEESVAVKHSLPLWKDS